MDTGAHTHMMWWMSAGRKGGSFANMAPASQPAIDNLLTAPHADGKRQTSCSTYRVLGRGLLEANLHRTPFVVHAQHDDEGEGNQGDDDDDGR